MEGQPDALESGQAREGPEAFQDREQEHGQDGRLEQFKGRRPTQRAGSLRQIQAWEGSVMWDWMVKAMTFGMMGYMASQMANMPSLPSMPNLPTVPDVPTGDDERVGEAAKTAREKAMRAFGTEDTNITGGLGLSPGSRRQDEGPLGETILTRPSPGAMLGGY